MKARLLAHNSEDIGKSWIIETEVTIGRSSDNKIRLKNKRVSHAHARIWFDAKAKCFFLEDLKSSNGTMLAGKPVRMPERLLALDVITLGRAVELIFQILPETAGA